MHLIAIIPPAEHDIIRLLAQVAVLAGVARLLGQLLARIGQPPVIGELAAGILLGPSVLGALAPNQAAWLFPHEPVSGAMLVTVGWIGVLLLLVETGAEADLSVLGRHRGAAGIVSASSLVVPLIMGAALGYLLPASFRGGDKQWVFAAFLGTALGISALPVVARVLADLGLLHRSVGQLILTAATVNDVIGWLLLGLISGIATTGRADMGALGRSVGGIAALLVLLPTLGQRVMDRALRLARHSRDPTVAAVVVIVFAALACGIATGQLRAETALGAFMAGMLVGRSRYRDQAALDLIRGFTRAVLAPVFFATAGLRADLGQLLDRRVWPWALAILGVATLAKFLGGFGGGYLARLPTVESAALGVGLNARGALEIVVASVGLGIGVLNDASYTAIVLMAIATSAMTPPLLKRVLRNWAGTLDEQERLAAVTLERSSVLVGSAPVLALSRGSHDSVAAALLAHRAWPPKVPLDWLTVGEPIDGDPVGAAARDLAPRPGRVHRPRDECPIPVALRQVRSGYGALVVGLPDHHHHRDSQDTGAALRIAGSASVPVILVRRERMSGSPVPPSPRSILVPAVGTTSSRAAQELAFRLARPGESPLHVAHVQTRPQLFATDSSTLQATALVDALLDDATTLAAAIGVAPTTVVRTGDVSTELLALSIELEVDLIVLGVRRRTVTNRGAFLGHTAEYLLENAPAAVALVVLPPGWGADTGVHPEH